MVLNDKIHALRSQIASDLPNHPIHLHDQLPSLVLAFLYAYQQWQLATTSTDHFDKALAEATSLRKQMLAWAPTAVLWNVFQQSELDAILAGAGYSDTADDAVTLGRLWSERWDRIDGKVGFAKADADRAVAGQSLLKMLGERGDVDSEAVRNAKDDWEWAYTVLVNAYTEVQAAVLCSKARRRCSRNRPFDLPKPQGRAQVGQTSTVVDPTRSAPRSALTRQGPRPDRARA